MTFSISRSQQSLLPERRFRRCSRGLQSYRKSLGRTIIKQSVHNFKEVQNCQGLVTIFCISFYSAIQAWHLLKTRYQKMDSQLQDAVLALRLSCGRKALYSFSISTGLYDRRKTSCICILGYSWHEVVKGRLLASRDSSSTRPSDCYSDIIQIKVGLQLRKNVQLCGNKILCSARLGSGAAGILIVGRVCRFVQLHQRVLE